MPPVPEWIVPMAATLTEERFADPAWRYERKYDGIRLVAFKRGDTVELYSRNHLPQDLPAIARAIGRLPPRDLVLDGEVEWDGSELHVFDVLWIDDRDLRGRPLDARLAELAALPLEPPLRRVAALDDAEPWQRAAAEGWEGVIAKQRDSVYESKRSRRWLKMKCDASQELVVGGFTDPQGKRVGLGALLVGYYDGDDLVFAGKVGTGLGTTAQLVALRARLDALVVPAPPFTRGTGLPRAGRHWVRPELVVQVAFMEWTGHDKLRHPRLVGFRADKAARGVRRER